jgi:hypothetical protein
MAFAEKSARAVDSVGYDPAEGMSRLPRVLCRLPFFAAHTSLHVHALCNT